MANAAFDCAVPLGLTSTSNTASSHEPEHTTLQKQAQSGKPEAVAAWLNQEFAAQEICFKAVWKETYLTLLVEAKGLPEAQDLLGQVQTKLEQLPLESTQTIHFYGRILGQQKPQWGYKFQLSRPKTSEAPQPFVGPTMRSLTDWLNQGHIPRSQEPVPNTQASVEDVRFLRCCLSPQDVILIPLVDIQSVFKTSLAAIVPVPDMPEMILGVHNHRGDMLWMVDLNAQLGLGSCTMDNPGEQELVTIVVMHQSMSLGLVTQADIRVETQSSEQLRKLNEAVFPREITPYLAGYLQSSGSPILNVATLISQC